MRKKKQTKKIKTKRTLRPTKKKQPNKHQKLSRAKVQIKTVSKPSKQPILAMIAKACVCSGVDLRSFDGLL